MEQKIANLGTNIIIKALKYKKIELDDMRAIADKCAACEQVGASASTTVRARYGDNEVQDVNLIRLKDVKEPVLLSPLRLVHHHCSRTTIQGRHATAMFAIEPRQTRTRVSARRHRTPMPPVAILWEIAMRVPSCSHVEYPCAKHASLRRSRLALQN